MEELLISSDEVEVVVLPAIGARIHRMRVFGHDLLRTPATVSDHHREPFAWGAYVMAPWCNRIAAGPVAVGSKHLDLAANFSDGSVIHGQVYARPWEWSADGALRVNGGGEGWPWQYEVTLHLDVADLAVRLDLQLVNRSTDPMPAGLGIHPWFRRPLLVAIHGDVVHPLNLATKAWPEPVAESLDLRDLGEMADDLDATWTELADPPVELAWPHLGLRAEIRITSPTRYVVAANSGELDAIAIEPQTHAPQGIRRMLNREPGALTTLDPGEALDLHVELVFRPSRERSAHHG